MQKIAIIGWEEGIAGQIDSWIENLGFQVDCFIYPDDDFPENVKIPENVNLFDYPEKDSFKNRPLFVCENWDKIINRRGNDNCIIAISENILREKQIKYAISNNIKLINAIHPSTIFLPEVNVGKNVIIHAGSIVGYRSVIEDGVILNTGTQIDHHCRISSCATLNPGSILAGNVLVKKRATIHTGAVVKNRIKIGKESVVGAGAVVIQDVEDKSTVVGVPAKMI